MTKTISACTGSGEKTQKDEYKRKFRPFFDQLYDKLTKSKQEGDAAAAASAGGNRRIAYGVGGNAANVGGNRKLRPYKAGPGGWRVRSTTTISPYTLNAEIYEVHPGSRLRITTTQKPAPAASLADFPAYEEDDYDVEPVTER